MFTGSMKQEVIAATALIDGASGCEASMEKAFDVAGPEDMARTRRSRDVSTSADITLVGANAATAKLATNSFKLLRVGSDWYIDGTS